MKLYQSYASATTLIWQIRDLWRHFEVIGWEYCCGSAEVKDAVCFVCSFVCLFVCLRVCTINSRTRWDTTTHFRTWWSIIICSVAIEIRPFSSFFKGSCHDLLRDDEGVFIHAGCRLGAQVIEHFPAEKSISAGSLLIGRNTTYRVQIRPWEYKWLYFGMILRRIFEDDVYIWRVFDLKRLHLQLGRSAKKCHCERLQLQCNGQWKSYWGSIRYRLNFLGSEFLFSSSDAKRLIGRPWKDLDIQADRKHWPFEVVEQQGMPKIKVNVDSGKEKFAPEEVTPQIMPLHINCNCVPEYCSKSRVLRLIKNCTCIKSCSRARESSPHA